MELVGTKEGILVNGILITWKEYDDLKSQAREAERLFREDVAPLNWQ